ncbi:uncharacterized protein LOC124160765 isoform X2 [Ischnura elegans]|uniref:uncharacterized protein LOC124160765 isoform X2 n=1 Tax=Ischnura elegans TaxID=197161 RepID=UPI001ED8776C|nr:uncharacterized protein LOC124160765 isoform X2 [Ischnura elegans]
MSEGSEDIGADQAIAVDEHILALEMNMGKLPKLPIYRPKGVWTDVNDVQKEQALIWAYNFYSTSTEKARAFVVNAVSAIFEWNLLMYCSETCSNQGPCPKCGHWKWTSEPVTGGEESDDNLEWAPKSLSEIRKYESKYMEDAYELLNHPQKPLVKGPWALITKEGMRRAVSVIIATKADFWAEGPKKMEATNVEEGEACKVMNNVQAKLTLGKQTSALLKDLYPRWNVDDAAEVVLAAGNWANTRNILTMFGETPLQGCIPVWNSVPEAKLILSPEIKKNYISFPAGTEELVSFLAIAKELLATPMVLYFPKAEDLLILLTAEKSVRENPFNHHKCALELGMYPMTCDIKPIYGRLGSFHLAKAKASNQPLPENWSLDHVKGSDDFDVGFLEICDAFYGNTEEREAAACLLLRVSPKNETCTIDIVLEQFKIPMSDIQKLILNV